MYALRVEHIEYAYEKESIIKDISFNIKKGEFISIIGPNGSGKSTLLKTLNHIYTPSKGEVYLYGEKIKNIKRQDIAKKISLVPQETHINYEFTVKDIVTMGRHPYKRRFERENPQDQSIVEEALKLTSTLDLKDRFITEISGGEKQRVIIAKALAQNSSIILLDEPTSSLDINHQIEVLNLLKNLNKEKKTTVIIVLHDINLAARYSDKIIFLNDGEIISQGSPEEVITEENIKKAYDMEIYLETNKHTNSPYLIPVAK